ncbi:conjugal transfer protein (plasmid) [Streptomyces sp. NBC_00445]|uniref:hypothetical protein n=1 Tax=Streptomyces sp. NBC_00445 TaxID=2975745 RepID=UPI002E20292B
MSADEERLVGHSYTRARKHPLVIGKLPGAGRLPGGPYTITQVVTMVATFLLLVVTRRLWAHFGGAVDALIMVAFPWGLAWVLRYARLDGRDPARALRSLLIYVGTPADGRLSGSPQHHRRPRLAATACTVHVRSTTPTADRRPAPTLVPARSAAPMSVAGPTSARPARHAPSRAVPASVAASAAPRPARTGLQSLLASLDERDQSPASAAPTLSTSRRA